MAHNTTANAISTALLTILQDLVDSGARIPHPDLAMGEPMMINDCHVELGKLQLKRWYSTFLITNYQGCTPSFLSTLMGHMMSRDSIRILSGLV